ASAADKPADSKKGKRAKKAGGE
ncbi:hypothetical protein LCGC14_2305640, partial [marine sediment metagenome]